MLSSLSDLKDHGLDNESDAQAFYWSEHQLPGSGIKNWTAKAFSLHTLHVTCRILGLTTFNSLLQYVNWLV